MTSQKNKNTRLSNKQNPISQAAASAVKQPQQGYTASYSVHQERSVTIFDPSVVKAYNEIVPGAADRILQQFELNSEAERTSHADAVRLSQDAMSKQAADNQRRDWMAFALMIAIIGVSGLFAWLGKTWMAAGTMLGLFGYVGYAYFKWRK